MMDTPEPRSTAEGAVTAHVVQSPIRRPQPVSGSSSRLLKGGRHVSLCYSPSLMGNCFLMGLWGAHDTTMFLWFLWCSSDFFLLCCALLGASFVVVRFQRPGLTAGKAQSLSLNLNLNLSRPRERGP